MSDPLQTIAARYTNFSMTSDGVPEINSLAYLPFEANYPSPPTTGRLAVVLIEARLLDMAGDPTLRTELLERIRRFKGDLRAEGLHTRFLLANLYRGSIHKDGRIVLALRRFFKEVKATYSKFEGAVLIGDFPETTLVRRVSWCPGFWNPKRLAVGTELISERADIVISDLNGNWESIYRQADFDAEEIEATPDATTAANGWFDGESVRNCEFSSTEFTVRRSRSFRDAFYMDDAIYSIREHSATRLRLRLYQAERNNEVHVSERSSINIIAKPEIAVSRVNAYHIALNPDPAITGSDGRSLLDAAGNPQAISSATPRFDTGSQWRTLFTQRDFDLERRLLIDYFDRNHRFRIGAFARLPFRGAVVSGTTDFNPDGYAGLVNAAAADFGSCVKTANADLRQYVAFHKTPAVFKYIIAHSNAHYSEFRGDYDPAGLAADVGGPPLRWIHRDGQHIPSFEGLGGAADLFVHRAMWQHDTLADAGACVMIHGGCNVNSVDDTQSASYVDRNYARWNNAEGLLFFTNAVALFSRAKGFNDSPGGFADGYRLSDRANFGSCVASYFNAQANDGGLTTYNIQRKRAYFWSVNGDWTVRIRNKNGLGILKLDGGLATVDAHPTRAWIDGWNFDAALNRIRGVGDVDGDGRDEFVITSDWGIGLLKYDGHHFRCLMAAPRDTWFGGWRYDATVNPGRDQIKEVADFTSSGKRDVLIWSSWGLATLEYTGATLYPSRIYANGTRLGGWVLNTADNRYWGCGRFDADSKLDLVMTSPWGLGLISLERRTHVYMAANGTRFGGWLLNTADNQVRLVGDFDGDGYDEILISSPWGIGVLKLVNGALTSVAMHQNGSSVDGYVVRNTNTFAVADNLRGGAKRQIVVTDATGVHVLELSGNRLCRIAVVEQGQRIDGWVIDTTNNRLQPAGDLDGDGRAELFIRSPWGFGVLGLDGSNRVRCQTLTAYGSMLGDWHLQASDYVVGHGRLSGTSGRTELLAVKP